MSNYGCSTGPHIHPTDGGVIKPVYVVASRGNFDGNGDTMFEDTRPKKDESLLEEKPFRLFDGEPDPVD